MKNKELIEKLDLCKSHNYDMVKYYLPDNVCDEIIKRLKELDTLTGIIDTCYLEIVKAYTMLRLGEIKEE